MAYSKIYNISAIFILNISNCIKAKYLNLCARSVVVRTFNCQTRTWGERIEKITHLRLSQSNHRL